MTKLVQIYCLSAAALLIATPVALAETQLSAEELARREESLKGLYADCLTQMHEGWCVRLLTPLGWYPRDDAECADIAARVDKVIGLGGEAKYQDLFKNERCARLGLMHSAVASKAPDEAGPYGQYAPCEKLTKKKGDFDHCTEAYGKHNWLPHWNVKRDACKAIASNLEHYVLPKNRSVPLLERPAPTWQWYFRNERCWRMGLDFLEPELSL